MNKSILIALVALIATCFNSSGASITKHKVIVAGWNADTGLVAAVSSYVGKEYKDSLQSTVCCPQLKGDDFKSAVAELTRNTNDLVVILASAGKGKPLAFATVVDIKKKLAYVNIDFLATGITNASVTNKQYYWRVEREAMKSVGLLLGKSPCFNPRCVMFNHVGLDGLDKKGRNLCPPCRFKKVVNN